MPSISYQNKSVYYDDRGNGLPVIFLHGFGENRHMWDDVLPYFRDCRTVTIDLPGSGESETATYSMARMAKAVRAVLRRSDIKKCVLVGHSMGGYVTLAFANLYPELLWGYCLFHSHPYADTEAAKANRNKGMEFVRTHGVRPFFRGLLPKLFPANYLPLVQETIEKLVDAAANMSPEAVVNQLRAMRDRPDRTDVLRSANVPVCFIIGKLDAAVPLENSLNQTFLPDRADIHFFEDLGHMGMFTAPDRTLAALQRFVKLVTDPA